MNEINHFKVLLLCKIEGPENATRGLMGANQNSSTELSLSPNINLTRLSSNSVKTV
jgi:hypothetical protein